MARTAFWQPRMARTALAVKFVDFMPFLLVFFHSHVLVSYYYTHVKVLHGQLLIDTRDFFFLFSFS